jgi:RecB family exonuclease
LSTIKTWSFSRLGDFEKCRYKAKLKYIDKIPEPKRPLPAGKSEHANDRGSRVHECAEAYIKGGVELIPELREFKERFNELRDLFTEKKVELEGEWAFDQEWNVTAWNSETAWCRMKLDAYVRVSSTHARVIDYKTGRKYGNEVKHAEQGQLYQLASFIRHPELESIDVEFWYVDQGIDQDLRMSFTREQGTRYIDKYHRRGCAITDAIEFPPNPNAYSCKWCPYLGGACEYGVSQDVINASKHNFKNRFGRKL